MTERMTTIAVGGLERLSFATKEMALGHARLDQDSPVMTLREFDALIASWRADNSADKMRTLLDEHSPPHGRSQCIVVEACAIALLRRRGELIGGASEAFESSEAQRLLQEIEAHSLLLEQLILEQNVLSDTHISKRVEIFLTMRTQTAQFANRLSDADYATARQSLREQLYRATAFLRDSAADVLKELKPWDRMGESPDVAGAAELKETRERLYTIFAEFLCEEALARFTRVGGVAAIGDFLKSPAHVWLMYTTGTVFHQPACRGRLLAIAQDGDEVVAQNFFVYLRTIAGQEGLAGAALASDASLIVPAWQAASRLRPQPKMRGQVVELARRLREALKNEQAIQLPRWAESPSPEDASASAVAAPEQAEQPTPDDTAGGAPVPLTD